MDLLSALRGRSDGDPTHHLVDMRLPVHPTDAGVEGLLDAVDRACEGHRSVFSTVRGLRVRTDLVPAWKFDRSAFAEVGDALAAVYPEPYDVRTLERTRHAGDRRVRDHLVAVTRPLWYRYAASPRSQDSRRSSV